MFKKLTEKERLRNLQAENAQLAQKNTELEDAVLELGQIISEAQNGETVSQEN